MVRNRLFVTFAACALATTLVSPVLAQTSEDPVVLDVADVEWNEMFPGVDFGAVYGDFSQEAHAKMVQFAPGVVAPMHTHTHAYHGVVIHGTVINPYEGEDPPVEMGPGSYWYVPAGMPHKTGCVSEEPCLFYTHGDEKWDIELVEGEGADSR